MDKYHEIGEINFTNTTLSIYIDGKMYEVDLLEHSKKLAHATELEKNTFEISPSGYGIHWPLLDEDLSIDGILGITHSPHTTGRAS